MTLKLKQQRFVDLFHAKFGAKNLVTRPDIQALMQEHGITWPHWLTVNKQYRDSRGVYNLAADSIVSPGVYNLPKQQTAEKEAAKAEKKAAKEAEKAEKKAEAEAFRKPEIVLTPKQKADHASILDFLDSHDDAILEQVWLAAADRPPYLNTPVGRFSQHLIFDPHMESITRGIVASLESEGKPHDWEVDGKIKISCKGRLKFAFGGRPKSNGTVMKGSTIQLKNFHGTGDGGVSTEEFDYLILFIFGGRNLGFYVWTMEVVQTYLADQFPDGYEKDQINLAVLKANCLFYKQMNSETLNTVEKKYPHAKSIDSTIREEIWQRHMAAAAADMRELTLNGWPGWKKWNDNND